MKTELKTLVIHPDDRSTDFLKGVWRGHNDWDVRTKNLDYKALLKEAEDFDRIVMLGHGCRYGLFSHEGLNFTMPLMKGGLIIDKHWSPLLRSKEVIGIMCYGAEFAREQGLSGTWTNMFISEEGEAQMMGVTATLDEIEASNDVFGKLIGKYADDPDIYDKVMAEYNTDSELVQYNRNGFYHKSKSGEVKTIGKQISYADCVAKAV